MRCRFHLLTGPLLLAAFSASALAAGFQINWVCDPKEKRLYRRDLGVVCWDGQTYRKDDPGGIPQYMTDYFDQMRRDLQQKTGDMNRHVGDVKSQRTAATPVLPERSSVAIPKAPQVRHKPVSPEDFASISTGMKRAEVIARLSEPAGSISIPNDDHFVEIWTYTLTDGSMAKVRIEDGAVASHQSEKGNSGR